MNILSANYPAVNNKTPYVDWSELFLINLVLIPIFILFIFIKKITSIAHRNNTPGLTFLKAITMILYGILSSFYLHFKVLMY